MKLQSKLNKIIVIWLVIAINVITVYSSDVEYYAEQDTLYPNLESVINHPKLKSYLSKPDTFNLQLTYGWGRDIGLKHPEVGFWVADTLLALARKNNDHRAVISSYSLTAQMYQQSADIYNSIKSFQLAIRYGEEHLDYNLHPNFDKLGINYVYLGDLYYEIGDSKNAKKYYRKGWEILSKITDLMIKNQDLINANLHRAYTTYRWDKQYSKLKLGLILSEDTETTDIGVSLLEELWDSENNIKGLLQIYAGFYLAKAELRKKGGVSNKYISTAYDLAKRGMLYNIQAEIGLFILINKLDLVIIDKNQLIADVGLAIEKTGNVKHKYQYYKLLSKIDKSVELSLTYLDSAYTYREIYYNQENLRRIGKIQSDLEYQNDLKITKQEEEIAQENLLLAIIAIYVFSVIVIILIYLLKQRKKLLHQVNVKNEKISSQNSRLADLITSREELIGILGHDLRTPILGMRLSTKNLIDTISDRDIKNELVDIEASASGLEELLNSILDYAESNLNHTTSENVLINLEELIDFSVSLNKEMVKKKNIKVKTDLQVAKLNSNLFIISNVLNNIITNAIKFSYEGGTIRISTYSEDEFNIIKIEDSGIGIDNENLEKIRKQIKPKVQEAINALTGNGFGLLTSISQLEKLDANLFIESEVGVGTIVLIYLNSG